MSTETRQRAVKAYSFEDAYPEGYGRDIEKLCDWVTNFRGCRIDWATLKRLSHREYHFGNECPYRVVAEILRGRSDPRRPA